MFLLRAVFSLAIVASLGAQTATPDRIVAEWMLRMGGSVVLHGERRPVRDLMELPVGDFAIHTLNFTGVTQWGSSLELEMKRLPKLSRVKELYVNGRLWYDQPVPLVASTMALLASSTVLEKVILSKPVQTYVPFDDSVLKTLAPLTGLRELRVHQTRIPGAALAGFHLRHLDLNFDRTFNDKGMATLAPMKDLTVLYLRGTAVTDAGLASLEGLTELTELDLADTGITDVGLARLAGLKKLRRLNLQSSNVSDVGVAVLAGMVDLEELSLYRTRVSNAGLARLVSLRKLRNLDLRYSRVTVSGVRELAIGLPGCKALFLEGAGRAVKRVVEASSVSGEAGVAEWLRGIGGKVDLRDGHVTGVSLQSTTVTDRELAVLKGLPHLAELSLRDTEVSEIGLGHVGLLGSLEKLDLSHTLISDAGVGRLAGLKKLRVLWLGSTLVEGPGLAAVTGLRELRLENTPLKSDGLRMAAGMADLEVLSLRYSDVTNAGLAHLAGLGKLRELDLKGVDIGDEGLKTLAGMGQLEILDLSYGRFTAGGFGALAGLKNLKKLWLDQTRVNNESMAVLAGMGKLESVSLEYTAVGDAGFGKLGGLGGLRELRLDHTELTDASVAVMAGFRGLRYLDVYHTSITAAGAGRLRAALAGCEINFEADSARRERRT